MNPMAVEALASIVRWVLTFGAGWLVQHGIWTQANAMTYVSAAAIALITLGWSLWQKYKSRLTLLMALSSSRATSEADVRGRLASRVGVPSVTTPIDVTPVPKV